MKKRILCLIALSAFSVRDLRAETGVTRDEIVIGLCGPLTGRVKEVGLASQEGARAYFDYVNATGGVDGRRIRLISSDDQYDPEKAVACFREIQDKALAGVAFGGAPAAVKYAVLAEKNGFPIVGFIAGNQFLYEPLKRNVFLLHSSFAAVTASVGEQLWQKAGLRKFGIIYQNDALGSSFLDGLSQALAKHNSSIAAQASYEREAKDFKQAIEAVRRARPAVVVLAGAYMSVIEIAREIKTSGWDPVIINVTGSDMFVKMLGPLAEGAIIALGVPPTDREELRGVKLYRKVLKQYQPKAKPGQISIQGFINAMILVEGLKRIGKDLSREKLVAAIESIRDWDIGLGPGAQITYSAQRHTGYLADFFVVVKNGKMIDITDWKQFAR